MTVGAQGVKFILGMGSTMILARLLTPEDYGLIAMVSAVTGFVLMFKDMGLSMATVQKAEINHGQISTLFWINVGLSVIIALIIIAMAPAVAWFYDEPRLTSITMVIGLGTILSGGTAQHHALLQRNMRFTTMARIGIVSQIVGIATGIYFAWAGFHYWSLVFMGLASSLYTVIATWISSGWLPGRPVRGSSVRPMLAFGGYLTGFNFLNYFTRNADNLMIGYFLSAPILGLYSKAYNLLTLPIRQVNSPLSSVVLPALSSLQNDDISYRQYFIRALTAMSALSFPIVVFSMIHSESLVVLLLGSQWQEAHSIFFALGPAALMGAINVAPGWLFLTRNRTRTLFMYGLVAAPFTVICMILGLQWGAQGVAWGFSLAYTISYCFIIPLACYGSPVRIADCVHALIGPILACLTASVLDLTAQQMFKPDSPAMEATLGCTIFSICYISTWLAHPIGHDLFKNAGLLLPASLISRITR